MYSLTAICASASGRVVSCREHLAGWALCRSQRLPTTTRTTKKVLKASKGDQGGPAYTSSYSDMVQQREYELWQRQSRLYDTLLEQHDQEREHWHQERERWARQEVNMKQEIAELRAQLLYVLSSMTGPAGSAASMAAGTASSRSSTAYVGQQAQQPSAIPTQPPVQLPLGATGMSPAEQVRAVIDAVRLGGPGAVQEGEQPTRTGKPGSSAPKAPSAPSGPLSNQPSTSPLPRYAAELAAAVAVVDEMDVLSDALDFGSLADRFLSSSVDTTAVQGEGSRPPPLEQTSQQTTHTAVQPAPMVAPGGDTPEPDSASTPPAPDNPAAMPAPPVDPATDPPAAAAVVSGPRPTLVSGSEDLAWICELHRSLVEAGYYPGDDDVDDFFFGETTVSAVMTLQACEGLPETGVVDEQTWEVLLGPVTAPATPTRTPSQQQQAPSSSPAAQGGSPTKGAGTPVTLEPPNGGKAYQELFAQATSGTQQAQQQGQGEGNGMSLQKEVPQQAGSGETAGSAQQLTAWPVLMEGDGGREVHALHVALEQQGYYTSEDDMRWWQFGDSTLAALKTFQACSGLPESGVADPRTWLAMLGAGASPADLAKLRSGDSADEDLSQDGQGRVWLMGEQRWEDKSRLKRD